MIKKVSLFFMCLSTRAMANGNGLKQENLAKFEQLLPKAAQQIQAHSAHIAYHNNRISKIATVLLRLLENSVVQGIPANTLTSNNQNFAVRVMYIISPELKDTLSAIFIKLEQFIDEQEALDTANHGLTSASVDDDQTEFNPYATLRANLKILNEIFGPFTNNQ